MFFDSRYARINLMERGEKRRLIARFLCFGGTVVTVIVLAIVGYSLKDPGTTHAAGITKYARSTGGNWSDASTWSTASGGSADTTVPTSADDVILDGNSGAVTINATANAKSLTATSYTNTLTHNAGITLNVYGNVTFSAAMTYTKTNTSKIYITGSGTANLTTAGQELGAFQLYATVTLQDDLTMTGQLYRASLTLNTNSKTITFNGSGSLIGTGITFYNLYVIGADSTTASFSFPNNFTVTNELKFTGYSASNRLLINSSVLGTPRILTVTGTTVTTSNNVDFQDITFARTTAGGLDLTNGGVNLIGDCGGNSRTGGDSTVTFSTSATQTWANPAGGYWSVSTNWTSRVPLPQDDVVMNMGSNYNSGAYIYTDVSRLGKNIDWSNVTWTGTAPRWDSVGDAARSFYGSWTQSSSFTHSSLAGSLAASGRGSYSITNSGISYYSFYVNAPDGTYDLNDNLTISNNIFYMNAGTFNTNGYSISAFRMYVTGSVARTLNITNSTITLRGSSSIWDATTTTGLTFVSTGSTITLENGSNSASFVGGTLTYNDISIVPGTGLVTFSGAFTFRNMTMSTLGSKTLVFTCGTTYTMTGTSFISGSSSGYVSLIPTGSGNQPVINNTSGGKVVSDYIQVAGINVTPSNTWFPGAHSYANKGLWFDSSSGYVVAPNNATVNQFSGSTAYTVEAWTIATGAGESNNGRIFDKRSAAATGVQVQINATPNINVYADCSSSQNAYASSATISWYRMHHIVGVWTGSQIITYVDGVAGSSVATSGTPVNDSSLAMYIGNRLNDDRTFKGMIVSLRVYRNKGLSQSDVTAAFSAGPKAAQPVSGATSEYLFNEGSGSTLTDDISGVNGTIYTAVWSNTGWEIDTTAPEAPSTATATISGAEIAAGDWTGSSGYPDLTFSGASDSGVGLKGYYTYWGTSSDGEPTDYQDHVGSAASSQLFTPSGTSEDGHYYFRAKAVDIYGNTSTATTLFDLKYDHSAPTRPTYIAGNPAGYSQTNSFSFSWPAGSDPNGSSGEASGVKWYEYKRATDTAWSHTASLNDRSASDLTAYQEGANIFYVRTVDNVDNPSSAYAQVTYYWSGEAPAKPENLAVSPSSNDENSFTICWDKPSQEAGESPIIGYRYSINEPPTATNTTYVASTSNHTCIGPDSFATQQGENTIYVISENEAGHSSYLTAYYSVAVFSCSTSAPPAPTSISIYDSSDKVFSRWTLTLRWNAGTGQDSNFDHYSIERSLDGTNYNELAQTVSNTSYIDSGLSEQTLYYYRVRAVDNAGKGSAYSSAVSARPSGKYMEPPEIISAPVVSQIGSNSATVSWTTDRSSSSYVRYGKSPDSFTDSTGEMDNTVNHEVSLPGLVGATTYYIQVQSLDTSRDYSPISAYSETYSFATKEAPAISNVSVDNIALNSADISWETTTVSASKIIYGQGDAYDQEVEDISGTQTTKHSAKISSLNNDTLYRFRINATDSVGKELVSDSYSFQTLPLPKIESLKIESLSDRPTQTVKISWITNVNTSTTVEYFAEGVKPSEESKSKLEKDHSVEIDSLADSSVYTFIAQGRDEFGNLAQSEGQTYQTPFDTRPTLLSNIVTETSNVGLGKSEKAQIAVSWESDEPATSMVEYGQGVEGDFTQKTIEDTALVTNHLVIISDLDPKAPYHIRVVSKDKGNNVSQSESQTVIPGEVQESIFNLILNTMKSVFGWMMP